MSLLTRLVLGAVAFMVLDAIWLGVLMAGFYRTQLAPIARMAGGSIAPNWTAAFVVYIALGAGIAIFVVPRATGAVSALALGGLFGLVVYGVYDFTNLATLRQWPVVVTLVDTAWGAGATALASLIVWLASR